MALTNNKACWNCLKKTMVLCPELGVGWFKCSKCGATWIKMLKVVRPVLETKAYATVTGSHFSPRVASKGKKVKE